MKGTYILAIDTSCDDTSAAVITGTTVLSNVIASQTELHKPYGGVFPTVAKLAHKENIDRTIQLAVKRAHVSMEQITALAVTIGPGLAPALEVGIATAKRLAAQYKKPLIPVNHVEGHVVSVLAQPAPKKSRKTGTDLKDVDRLHIDPKFKLPALAIIVSGGHTQFIVVTKIGEYQVVGSTLDDAAGECLDKIGRMLNLGYPAGPVMEEFSKLGNKHAYPFPLPLTTVKTFDVSFSGMKTFARNLLEKLQTQQPLNKTQIYDFCASTQYAVFRHICYKMNKVLEQYQVHEVWLGGGVAANMTLRRMIRETLQMMAAAKKKKKLHLKVPYTKQLCADNAAMIGLVAGFSILSALPTFEQNGNNLEKIERKPHLQMSGKNI